MLYGMNVNLMILLTLVFEGNIKKVNIAGFMIFWQDKTGNLKPGDGRSFGESRDPQQQVGTQIL